jgi:hypothetical protein
VLGVRKTLLLRSSVSFPSSANADYLVRKPGSLIPIP